MMTIEDLDKEFQYISDDFLNATYNYLGVFPRKDTVGMTVNRMVRKAYNELRAAQDNIIKYLRENR